MKQCGLLMARWVSECESIFLASSSSQYRQRTLLGDPLFVAGMNDYQHAMLERSTIEEIRSKISDKTTLNVSAYDPAGLESLDT